MKANAHYGALRRDTMGRKAGDARQISGVSYSTVEFLRRISSGTYLQGRLMSNPTSFSLDFACGKLVKKVADGDHVIVAHYDIIMAPGS